MRVYACLRVFECTYVYTYVCVYNIILLSFGVLINTNHTLYIKKHTRNKFTYYALLITYYEMPYT